MTGRVLVVTPHADSHARMERLLRKAGFETEHASTFEAARPRLTVTTPDVLISDVHLGEYNGLHLAIVGRDRRPALVAIVVGPPDAVLHPELLSEVYEGKLKVFADLDREESRAPA